MKSAVTRRAPDAFRAWREHMGWTQGQAAEALGMSRINISRIENGVYTPQRITMLACAALAAGLAEWEPSQAPDATTPSTAA